MLARNFKSPKQLKISSDEYDALIKVLGMLERREFVWVPIQNILDPGNPPMAKVNLGPLPDNGFNMGWQELYGDNQCGTVRCIGGWVAHFMGEQATEYVDKYLNDIARDVAEQGLPALYWGTGGFDPTVEQAAQAIRNFLATGKPEWGNILLEGRS